MEYKGIDYINKTPKENVNYVFNNICVELIKRNELLFEEAMKLMKFYIEYMRKETLESDKKRGVLLELEPTWKAMEKELCSIKMLK